MVTTHLSAAVALGHVLFEPSLPTLFGHVGAAQDGFCPEEFRGPACLCSVRRGRRDRASSKLERVPVKGTSVARRRITHTDGGQRGHACQLWLPLTARLVKTLTLLRWTGRKAIVFATNP